MKPKAKTLLKWAVRAALALVILIGLLFVFRNSIFRVIAEWRIQDETGMRTEIGRLSSGILAPMVTVENLKLYNTAEFGGAPFATVPKLHLECDRDALARGKLRVNLLSLDLSEVSIVKNELGQTNVTQLLARVDKKRRERRKKKGSHWFEFQGIDELSISLGTARFIDLKTPADNREWHLNLTNQVVQNVRSDVDLRAFAVLLWLRSGGSIDSSMTEIIGQALIPKPRGSKTNKVHKAP